jgi:hypothetical protein
VRPLCETQAEFAAALLDPGLPVPAGCVGPDGRPDTKRFAVYRNNVAASLIEALGDSFPAVRRLVGEECLRTTAGTYIARDPPRSPVLLEYGAGFPDFLAGFEPLAQLPYLPDVARIERAWLEAYNAPEAEALDPMVLARVAEDRAGDLRFTLHPSVRIVRSEFPALSIWRTNVAAGSPRVVSLDSGAEDALLARLDPEVEVRAMRPGAAALLSALIRGKTLAEATEAASRSCESFDLTDPLTGLLESGLITGARLRRRRSKGTRYVHYAL